MVSFRSAAETIYTPLLHWAEFFFYLLPLTGACSICNKLDGPLTVTFHDTTKDGRGCYSKVDAPEQASQNNELSFADEQSRVLKIITGQLETELHCSLICHVHGFDFISFQTLHTVYCKYWLCVYCPTVTTLLMYSRYMLFYDYKSIM